MKMKFKRFLSGVMAVATLASVIVQPVAVSASELEREEIPFEQQYPELKEVQDSLDPDEIVAANDIEIAYGDEFEVEVDLSGIDGVDESKMKILFHEAKNEAGADFDTHTPDTYKAVYAVEPVSGHPSYRISRNITVKEPETETQSESSSEIIVDDDSGTGDTEQSEEDSESHRENTVDTKTELTVPEVLEQAESNGIDLYAMDAGETVTFMASAGNARSSQQVSVTRGTMYRYADYGYGSYLTYQYTVKFGNVSATAYCVQPSKPGPGSGTYTINKVGDGKALAKVCYYGTKASGDDGFFTEENGYGNLSADKTVDDDYFILTLYALAMEARNKGITLTGKDVVLGVGLPPADYGQQATSFKKYFLDHAKHGISFKMNGKSVNFYLKDVFVSPQNFAAVMCFKASLLKKYRTVNCIDIGDGTVDLLVIRNGKPDLSVRVSDRSGMAVLRSEISNAIQQNYGIHLDSSDVEQVLMQEETILDEKIILEIQRMAENWLQRIINKLHTHVTDFRTNPAVFLGGGSLLLRKQIENSPEFKYVEFIDDVRANAIGYEKLTTARLRRG